MFENMMVFISVLITPDSRFRDQDDEVDTDAFEYDFKDYWE